MKYSEGIKSLRHKMDKHFVLIGDESYLKEQFIKACQHFNATSTLFEFDPDREDEALSTISCNSLMGDRIIILRSIDKMDVERFIDPVKHSPDLIIMIPSEAADARSRAVTKVTGIAAAVSCDKLREYNDDYPEWVVAKAADAGYSLTLDQGKYLYAMVGPNMHAIVNELKKLTLYKGEDKNVTDIDLRNVTSCMTSSTNYDFLDHLLSKNLDKTLQSLDSYYRSQENFSELIYFMCSYTEKLLKISSLLDQKKTPDEIADRVDIPRYLIKTKYIKRAQELGTVWIMKLMNSLCNLEAKLRSFKGNNRIVFDNFIFTQLV